MYSVCVDIKIHRALCALNNNNALPEEKINELFICVLCAYGVLLEKWGVLMGICNIQIRSSNDRNNQEVEDKALSHHYHSTWKGTIMK